MFLNFKFLNTKITKKLTVKKYRLKKNSVNQKYCVAKESLSSCGIFSYRSDNTSHFFKSLRTKIVRKIDLIYLV